MKSHSQRPIHQLLDLLGQRWTLRILWELSHGPLRFRELRSRCEEVSPSLLNQRLKLLRERQIVLLDPESGYQLTERAERLIPVLLDLHGWAEDWIERGGSPGPPTSG